MAEVLDCRGLKCPQPVLKTAIKANTLPAGTTLEVLANCPSFQDDVTKWSGQSGKVLISFVDNGDHQVATVQL